MWTYDYVKYLYIVLHHLGTVYHRKTLMLQRWTAWKVGLREKEIRRWTSSKTNSLPSPIGCKTLYQYEDCIWDQDTPGAAAAPGKLPGELSSTTIRSKFTYAMWRSASAHCLLVWSNFCACILCLPTLCLKKAAVQIKLYSTLYQPPSNSCQERTFL